MFLSFGLMSLVAAIMLSHSGGRWPHHIFALERAAGASLLAGLALIGAALPWVA